MSNNSEKLIKREAELKRLNNFLLNPKGGSILLAGDRGSGKTTLVNSMLDGFENNKSRKSRQTKRSRRLLFWDNKIILYIPLIIQSFDPSDDNKQEELSYRKLLLRTIARSMESELLTRRYSKQIGRAHV